MLPLADRRIVVTRAEPDAAPLAARLAALGADPVVAPAIEIVYTAPEPLDAALARLRRFDWVLFTSRHAVEAVFRRTQALEGPRVGAVGPVTADSLVEHGVSPDVVPRRHTAEGLLDALGDVRDLRVFFPASAIARRTLPEKLKRRGALVLEVAVYRTAPVERTYPDLADVDAVTFTSVSSVRGLLLRNRIADGVAVFCIGPTTADAARAAGLIVTAVAHPHTEDGLIDAMCRAYSEGNHGK